MDDPRAGIEASIRDRAARDAEFREALLADARATVSEALDIDIPASLTVRIVEERSDEVVLVIPAPQAQAQDLTDAELDASGAGWSAGSAGSCASCNITCGC